MSLEFHHLFVFTEPGAPVVDQLVNAGFVEGSPNRHPGQGTENRRIFFDNGMLEFIWIENVGEARGTLTAPTRLWERSRYQDSGYSPFGVGLWSRETEDEPFEGWAYRPPYLPAGIHLWQAQNEAQPWEPMIFYISGVSSAGPGGQPTKHPNGARAIKTVGLELVLPGHGKPAPRSDACAKLQEVTGVKLTQGRSAAATVMLFGPGADSQTVALHPGCPITLTIVGA